MYIEELLAPPVDAAISRYHRFSIVESPRLLSGAPPYGYRYSKIVGGIVLKRLVV